MAIEIRRKVSPRAPSTALDEAITRVSRMYKAEGRHPTPAEVAMKHIGYSSKNGAAIAALASLGYWGLIERPKDGLVMVAKGFEDYEFTPHEAHKRELLCEFLRRPPLFASLLDQYGERLPSDATLKYDLIQRGFLPTTADACVSVFKKSVEFARYFDRPTFSTDDSDADVVTGGGVIESTPAFPAPVATSVPQATLVWNMQAEQEKAATQQAAMASGNATDTTIDRIPIRLAGGRRAWLEIPTPFFSADKKRIKQHIDLLLTDDEDERQEEEL